MVVPAGPGYSFIQQYVHGLPETRWELARCIDAYIDYLLAEACQTGEPPVNLEAIFERFALTAVEEDLKGLSLDIKGMNVAESGMITADSSDIQTRQRFTRAHELLETLLAALKGNRYPSSPLPYIEEEKKERHCNWGAARLLMPVEFFDNHVRQSGIGIESAEAIGRRFETSRLATLWHMVNYYPKKCGLIIWKRAHKPTEQNSIPASNQIDIWEDKPSSLGPQKKVRVQWAVFGREARRYHVPEHKSVDADSLIAEALEDGELKTGREYVDLVGLDGEFEIEAAPFSVRSEMYILSLFHWPKRMFADEEAQENMLEDKKCLCVRPCTLTRRALDRLAAVEVDGQQADFVTTHDCHCIGHFCT
jgi:Zn-dependent peptidase ImmA (M78 family)